MNQINGKVQIDYFSTTKKVVSFFCAPFAEIILGIRSGTLPWVACLLMGCAFGIGLLLKLDLLFLKRLDIIQLRSCISNIWKFYASGVLLSGFIVWGIYKALEKKFALRQLSDALLVAGLKNPLGRLPGFVFDRPIDSSTRKLRLTRAGFDVKDFISAKSRFESSLKVYVDEFRENRERGTIDVIYAHAALEREFSAKDRISKSPKDKFLVGKTRAREIYGNINEVPHLLIAGETGGGKSTFLRQFLTKLYLNNPSFTFFLVDLKGGLEFQIFEGLKRVQVVSSMKTAMHRLQALSEELDLRMKLIKACGAKDLTSLKLKLAQGKDKSEDATKAMSLDRKIVVIDEAAELFLAGNDAEPSEVKAVKFAVSRLARLGRAVGVHLIVATQRPDVKSLDPQVKANLPGILCFQVTNLPSSMTILNNGRALDLPKIPGRAIWKCGAEMVEIQTPFLDEKDVEKMLPEKTKISTLATNKQV